jgi:hypothetical protein
MGRRRIFEKYQYAFEFEPCEDLELWTRIIPNEKVANLSEPLLHYRIHPHQISRKASLFQSELTNNFIESFVYEISDRHDFFKFYSTNPLVNNDDLLKYKSVENSIISYWSRKGVYLNETDLNERLKKFIKWNLLFDIKLSSITFKMLIFIIGKIGFYSTSKILLRKFF